MRPEECYSDLSATDTDETGVGDAASVASADFCFSSIRLGSAYDPPELANCGDVLWGEALRALRLATHASAQRHSAFTPYSPPSLENHALLPCPQVGLAALARRLPLACAGRAVTLEACAQSIPVNEGRSLLGGGRGAHGGRRRR